MAASRAACDAGWVPPCWQVGQTGKKVAPELYLAIALSGASQHLMGIADAKVIAAINVDRDAPIFKHCRFGLVEDYRKVVGPLREAVSLPDERPAGHSRSLLEHRPRLGDVRAVRADRGRGRRTASTCGFASGGAGGPRPARPAASSGWCWSPSCHPATRTWRRRYAGSFHALLFWGFIILTVATTVVLIDYDFGIPIMHGWFYLYFQSLIVDLFGAAAIVGTVMAAWRRWIARPTQLVYAHEASGILVAIFAS